MPFIKEHIYHLNAIESEISWFGIRLVCRMIEQLLGFCQPNKINAFLKNMKYLK